MHVPAEHLTQTDQWTAQGSMGTVRAELLAAAGRGAKVLVTQDGRMELRFGSRTAASLGAVLRRAARRRPAVRVRVGLTAESAQSVRVAVRAEEDPGWSVISMPAPVGPARRALVDAVARLRAATAA